jgi:hypothetical protein
MGIQLAVILLFAWVLTSPTAACALVAHLKRRWRQYLIQREGTRAMQEFAQKFRKQASRQGFDRTLVEHVLRERKALVIERLGTQAVNKFLGERTPWELYE